MSLFRLFWAPVYGLDGRKRYIVVFPQLATASKSINYFFCSGSSRLVRVFVHLFPAPAYSLSLPISMVYAPAAG